MYQDMWGELVGTVPRLPQAAAKKYVNKAWKDIRESRLWSFLTSEATVFFPDAISAGTVQITLGSNTIIGDATAAAAFTAAALGMPPLIDRQFRVASAGPLYNITAISTTVNPNDTLTLDQVIGVTTNAAATYTIYRAYVKAPATNFLRWASVRNPDVGYFFRKGKTQVWLDIVDPTRGAVGQAFVIVDYKADATDGLPWYEFWPHQTAQAQIWAKIEVTGVALSAATDTLPGGFPEELVVKRALTAYAYPWANANKGRFPELNGTNWSQLRLDDSRDYTKMYLDLRRQDEERFSQSVTINQSSRGLGSPYGADFQQNHDMSFYGGGW